MLADLEFALQNRLLPNVKVTAIRNAIEETRILLEGLALEETQLRQEVYNKRHSVEIAGSSVDISIADGTKSTKGDKRPELFTTATAGAQNETAETIAKFLGLLQVQDKPNPLSNEITKLHNQYVLSGGNDSTLYVYFSRCSIIYVERNK